MFWRIVMVLLLVALGGVFLYRDFVDKQIANFVYTPPPTVVAATTLEPQTWQSQIEVSGELVAIDDVLIKPEVPGVVVSIPLRQNKDVYQKGDILFELDASLDKAELKRMQLEQKLARQELARQRQLYKRKAIPRSVLDSAVNRAEVAAANLVYQQTLIDKKTIRAPINGQLEITPIDLGEYINAGEPIMRMVDISRLFVRFNLPEEQISLVDWGNPIQFTADARPDRVFEAKVRARNHNIDPDTHSVLVLGLTEDNPENLLNPGMFVRVNIAVNNPEQVFVLPQTAISYKPYGNIIYVINAEENEDGSEKLTVQQRFVKLGARRGDVIAVVDGLQPGERVVTVGQHKLRNGAAVKIDTETAAPVETAPTPADS